jgi:LysM repeat protein
VAPSFKLANAAALIVGCSLFLTACAGKEREMAVTPSRPEPSSGQAAVTPPKQEPSPGQEVIYVVVQRGQSLDRIAQLYHVEKSDVIAANQLKPPYTLEPGAILTIPVAKVKSVGQSPTIGASPASASRDGVVQRKPKRPKPELIEPDDVPTHSLDLPKSSATR